MMLNAGVVTTPRHAGRDADCVLTNLIDTLPDEGSLQHRQPLLKHISPHLTNTELFLDRLRNAHANDSYVMEFNRRDRSMTLLFEHFTSFLNNNTANQLTNASKSKYIVMNNPQRHGH
ncbi:hypothetical protein KIN20_033604 [Parelaphostrongylus tenuis]|uniref:Uncharacterized protein n=1 Tax=Parelaphostrongylus tenuis TaxID=148309 RepID=A0AAD5WJC4_PARTN|nr:hypothetical protein KIN20_033604 [Parelaphostrongylus tenuis]